VTPFKAGPLNAVEAAALNEVDRRLRVVENIQPRAPITLGRTGNGIFIGVEGLDVLLCEVVSSSGTPPAHTVKRKTRQGDNTVTDFVPATTLTNVLNPAAVAWPVGTLVFVTAIPDQAGYYWGWAVGPPVCFRYLDDVAATATCNEDGTITITLTKTYKYFTGVGTVSTSPCP